MIDKSWSLFGEGKKYGLRQVLGRLGIAHHAKRGGINQIDVSPHDFGKGHFGAAFREIAQ